MQDCIQIHARIKNFLCRGIVAVLLSCGFFCAGGPALADSSTATGSLKLVSTGIGDLNNMTIRAHSAILNADIFFAMDPAQAKRKFAELIGDKPVYTAGHGLFDNHAWRGTAQERTELQTQAHQIIRTGVSNGKNIVVIDYGDPTIYGPQTGYLQEFADLNPEVVPGISSFNAANAALKRGITQGKHSRSVILTAASGAHQGYTGKDTLPRLAQTNSTMVFYTMGMDLSEVVAQLKTEYAGETPMAIVFYAGSATQERVIKATLDTIIEVLGGKKLPFEHLIYVGDFLL